MKVRLRALSKKGIEGLKQFHEEVSKDLSKFEKVKLRAVDPLGYGRIRAKVFSESPFVLSVTNSKWKKMDKNMINIATLYPVIVDKWLPSLEPKIDYEVKLV